MTGYTAFLLSAALRRELRDKIPPAYPAVMADHITHRHGVEDFGDLFHPGKIEITGIADDGNGLQALIVKVDGKQYKPDGHPYHITWSLDPEKDTPPEYSSSGKYRPVHANDLVNAILNDPGHGYCYTPINPPLEITATSALISPNGDGTNTIKPLPTATQTPPPPAPNP